jgi:hypothetical protein
MSDRVHAHPGLLEDTLASDDNRSNLPDADDEVLGSRSASSSLVACAHPTGTKIKLVHAPGATPNVKSWPGEVDWIITLNGDALVTAVDDAGKVSAEASCLVPPPPK